MSKTEEHLPKNYTPYKEMRFCGNYFVDTPIAIEIDNRIPLLIGSGKGPRVWIFAPRGSDRKDWLPVVVDNISKLKDVSVDVMPNGIVKVVAAGKKSLVVREVTKDVVEVELLDLRPFGFDIHGDRSVLCIGQSQFKSNRVEKCRAAIGVGS